MEELSSVQKEKLEQVMEHIETIIDMPKVVDWCQKKNITVMIFGSRVRLQHRETSDLDIMCLLKENTWVSEQFILDFLSEGNEEFTSFLKKPLELDFKLNTWEADAYAGFTYNEDTELPDDLDFHFYWEDIPSYIEVDGDGYRYEVMEVEGLFDEEDNFII